MQNEGEELVQCPYEVSHRILKKRFQVHLGRCRRNHLKAEKVTCPFNVTHILNKPELEWHVSQCPNRSSYEIFKNMDTSAGPSTKEKPEKLEPHSELTVSSWDEDDVPTYNPQAYVQKANVMRSLQGAPPSAKKQFRAQERLRFLGIEKDKK